jgi:hypothetical protein
VTIRLPDTRRLDDLVAFLRDCDCRVVQVTTDELEVDLTRDACAAAARALARTGRCYRCGGVVEAALASLGSPACHDCRDTAAETVDAAPVTQWAATRVFACLSGWQALHPETAIEVL